TSDDLLRHAEIEGGRGNGELGRSNVGDETFLRREASAWIEDHVNGDAEVRHRNDHGLVTGGKTGRRRDGGDRRRRWSWRRRDYDILEIERDALGDVVDGDGDDDRSGR